MGTALFALFLGLALVAVGNMYSALARRMRSFKSAPGIVVGRAVIVTGNRSTPKFGEGGNYAPQVTYRYVIDGVELESNTMGKSLDGFKREIAERKLAEIPDQVVVWYDPRKPSDAYLRKHGPALGYVIMMAGSGLVFGALISLFG
ncbi:MAG: DUF3592 domain-containing protein [Polyangiaceae bacterium]